MLPKAFSQVKPTIAVEAFRVQPIKTSTQAYIQAKWSGDLATIGNSFAASFTEKLRKAGYTVVTRRNIDSLLEENRLAQQGIVDDEGTTKLRTADFRIVGTIQQFEETEQSNGFVGIVGGIAGRNVTQMRGDVLISVELIARDGTILATATGKSSKTGRINDTSGFGTKIDGKFFAIIGNSNKGAYSEAITNASNNSVELAVKDLATQLKKIDLNSYKTTKTETAPINNVDLTGIRFVVSFPDSPVAEEVFVDYLSSAKARIILGAAFDRNLFHNSNALESYCLNLRKNSGNAKYFVFGIIDSDRVNNQTNRLSMSIKIIDLTNFQLVHTESAQGSSIDISNKAGMDRVVKETTNKLLNSSMNKLITYNQNVTEKTNSVYSLELTGFQSLSSANRFIKILTKNENVESCEVVDFSNKTLFAEIKFKNKANYTETLEKDNDLLEMFLVSVKSVTNNKIVGDVIIR